MNPKNISIIAVAILVLLGIGAFIMSNPKNDNETVKEVLKISIDDVKNHDQKSDCWTVIDNSVYDITSYVQSHPGGDNILSACGVDATEYFNGEKPGQNGGTNDHGGQAAAQLSRLKIGELPTN